MEKKREEMKTARIAYDSQLQKIMTEEQYAAYSKKVQDRKAKWNLKENKFSIAFNLYYFVRSTTKNRTMKNIVYILVCASVIFFTACSSQDKNKKDGTQVLMQDSTEIAGPQRMQVSDVKTSFTYKGKEYQSSVVRRPDESLPIVKNEQGEKFVDNRITLRITCGGKQVVDKVFTKDNFASLVDAKFMKYSILEGLVYDKTTPQGIIYAASVCYPQSDLYVPIRLTITADGKISMAKEELMEDYQTDSID